MGELLYNGGMMAKYPIFLELGGRRAVVIGAGSVAARKSESLLAAGARLVVVAEHVENMPSAITRSPNVEVVKAKYSKDYLVGATIAIAATDNHELNKQIFRDCQELEILCNVVDEPELCDFYVPAVVKRGDLQVAVGTEGNCPAYAGHIRKKLEEIITNKHGQFLAELERFRKRVVADVTSAANRKALLGQLVDDESFECFVKDGPAAWRERVEGIIQKYRGRQ